MHLAEGEGKGAGVLQGVCIWGKNGVGKGWNAQKRARVSIGPFVLRGFICSPKSEILRDVSGEISADYFSVFQMCSVRVVDSTNFSALGQRVISHCSWS